MIVMNIIFMLSRLIDFLTCTALGEHVVSSAHNPPPHLWSQKPPTSPSAILLPVCQLVNADCHCIVISSTQFKGLFFSRLLLTLQSCLLTFQFPRRLLSVVLVFRHLSCGISSVPLYLTSTE